eukprot:m51a1_g51 hypothetical protein (214) ;mRNA; r:171080-172055
MDVLTVLPALEQRDLQRLCKERGLNTDGADEDLRERIVAWEHDNAHKFQNVSRVFHREDEEPSKDDKAKEDEDNEDEGAPAESVVIHENLKLRNYRPRHKELQAARYIIPRPEIPNVDKVIEETLAKLDAAKDDENVSLMPKKRNWDLKRDIKPKLDKLERRTQRAIYELLRQKLKTEAQEEEDEDEDEMDDEDAAGERLARAVGAGEIPEGM